MTEVPDGLDLNVTIEDPYWNQEIPDVHHYASSILTHTLEAEHALSNNCQLACAFTHDAHIQDLNQQFRGKDKPTNVLSFPAGEEEVAVPGVPKMLGDIILARETIAKEAKEQDKTFQDHTTHLLVHGCLHLLGYDHEVEEEAEIMEAKEVAILKEMGIENPYA